MNRVVVFTAGRFGAAVADQLRRAWGDIEVAPLAGPATNLDLVRGASFVAVAGFRRYVRHYDALDVECARHGVPWSSATLESTVLVQGPIVRPGGPCFRCYWRRRTSHFLLPDREAALDAAYAQDDELGPAGFFPSAVNLASAGLRLDARDFADAPGRVRTVELMTAFADETRVVRVHACSRCAPARSNGDRFVEKLIPSLRELGHES
jgi:hypothetical protein